MSEAGIFSAHNHQGSIRFFDSVGQAQDWAEQFSTATIRRDYDDIGWSDIATWNGVRWSYIHRKAKKARPVKKTRRRL